MKGGTLIYRCRSCGKIHEPAHVPELLRALHSISVIGRTTRSTGDPCSMMTDVHICSDGHFGITDLIGGSEDQAPQYRLEQLNPDEGPGKDKTS